MRDVRQLRSAAIAGPIGFVYIERRIGTPKAALDMAGYKVAMP